MHVEGDSLLISEGKHRDDVAGCSEVFDPAKFIYFLVAIRT